MKDDRRGMQSVTCGVAYMLFRRVLICLLAAVSVFGFMLFRADPAHALCIACACTPPEFSTTEDLVQDETDDIIEHLIKQLDDWQPWLETVFWPALAPVFPPMTHQLSFVAVDSASLLAPFFDAKQQLETQRLMDEMRARTHKDYKIGGNSLCTLVTNLRSLPEVERRAEENTHILSRWSVIRNNANVNNANAEGVQNTFDNRLDDFRYKYCDVTQNGNGFGLLCPGGSALARKRDADVDYARTLERGLTLDIEAINPAMTEEEEHYFALADNLYEHKPLQRMREATFNVSANKQNVLDFRSIAAKRSVAQSPYFAIAGLKAPAVPPSPPSSSIVRNEDTFAYMKLLLRELNISDADIQRIYGDRPSYYAQMEIMTKKIFQRPQFYTDLYDTPVNVDRKDVVVHAIGMMQDFDILQSHLRTEMMMSVMLELEVMKYQNAVQNKINGLTSEGQGGAVP